MNKLVLFAIFIGSSSLASSQSELSQHISYGIPLTEDFFLQDNQYDKSAKYKQISTIMTLNFNIKGDESFSNPEFIGELGKGAIKHKTNIWKGTLIGFGIGSLTGMLIGFIDGDDPPRFPCVMCMKAEEKALLYGGIMGVTGAVAGTVIAAIALPPTKGDKGKVLRKKYQD